MNSLVRYAVDLTDDQMPNNLTLYAQNLTPALPIISRNVAVIYRKVTKTHVIPMGKDHWFFLDHDTVYYCKGTSFDIVFLMESITKAEFIRDTRWESFFPQMKEDAIIMEAG